MSHTATCATCGASLPSMDGLCPSCVARSISTLFTRDGTAASFHDVAVPGYELLEVIGQGGMGKVFRAVRSSDGAWVAVKLISVRRANLEERFAREVAALSLLDHPHILRVLDSGVAEDERLFLVTELAQSDLARRLKQGPLPVQEAFRIFRETVAAIREAHRCGVVHRDIKPANILLMADGSTRVGDFSLAKLLPGGGAADYTLTRSTEVFGTPYYISPEVRRGATDVNERSNFYSLGVLLHEMLTGRLPLGEYEPASRLVPVPRAVDALIARCLQEAPARRPSTAEDLLRQLDRAQRPAPPAWLAWTTALLIPALAWTAWHYFFHQRTTPQAPPAPTAAATPSPAHGPALATPREPWRNSLDMPFVPITGTRVLFCQWETRRRDFKAFAEASRAPSVNLQRLWREDFPGVNDQHPVQPVNLQMAVDFCAWLTAKERTTGHIQPTQTYRLPTDAEWSTAAGLTNEPGATPEERHLSTGGIAHALFIWGRIWPPPQGGVQANFAGAECLRNRTLVDAGPLLLQSDGYPLTAPVHLFPSGTTGLHHLSGNVSEWCSTPWRSGSTERVLRGGSWNQCRPEHLRLDFRQHAPGDAFPTGAGFRVVLELRGEE